LIVSQAGISGSTKLGNYVTLAGQVGVVGHIEIGDQAIVAAQSGVSKSIVAKEVVFGSPAQPMREAKEQLARIGRLPKLYERVRKLEQAAGQPPNSLAPES
jgi:UDP-3-O-[3-hydroxymyristoyl] glucosamine N-acyltransferase